MSILDKQPFLAISDENNKHAVTLESFGLSLFGKDGRTKRAAFVRTDTGTGLLLSDAEERPRLWMLMTPRGPNLSILAENGSVLFSKP